VRDSAGNALPFFQPRDPVRREQSYGDYIAVLLPAATAPGQKETLEFRYAGRRVVHKMFSGIFHCQSYGWYPTRPTAFAARADFEMTFRSPKKYAFVATGSKVSETAEGEILVSTWKSDIPQAVAGFAFGDFKVIGQPSGQVNIQVFANRIQAGLSASLVNPPQMAPEVATEMGNSVRLFERYFGPYPFKNLYIATIPFGYGQGWPGLIYLSIVSFLSSTQRNFLGIDQHKEVTDFFRAHEVSHQWWGHRVGWKSYHDQWMSEGFAQFSGNLYVHMRQNLKEYLIRIREDRRQLLQKDFRGRTYESLGPVWLGERLLNSSESPEAYWTVIYNKGGLILHMLRMMLFDPGNAQNPEHRFMAMMQEFTRAYDNKPASTEDFKSVAEKYMIPAMNIEGNGKLDWFFRQYVYGTGIPQYSFRYSAQPAPDGKYRITATIAQSGVPDGWKDILPIYIHQGNNVSLLGWTRATQKENTVEFTLPFRPTKISLNHYEDVLADIK
jgi:aminopeptidase N